jgi:hypothetical protein
MRPTVGDAILQAAELAHFPRQWNAEQRREQRRILPWVKFDLRQ